MEKCQCVIVLFLLVLSLTMVNAQNCSMKETAKGSHCFCDYLESSLNGWSYTCIDSIAFESLYNVQFVVDHSLAFQCGEHEPNYHSIFQQLVLDEIQTFSFKSCPLPNVSYSEIIPYREKFPVEQIKIEQKRDNRTFEAEIFGNMSSSLKSLILSGNGIDILPENFLYNFTQLQYLSLSDNKLSSLPSGIFLNVENLVNLEITNNALESLPDGIFQNLRLLKNLYLYKNKLKELPENVFRNLTNLKILDLADNQLMFLPGGVFRGLSNIVHIRLRANWLRTIPKDLLNGTLNLKDIDLSLNTLMDPLPEELFYSLTQLEKVIITDCNLTQIPENFFSRSPNITVLHLERNSLTQLPKDIFLNNSMLKEINLNFNHISELPQNLLANQIHLEKFSLFKSNISVIPIGLFKRARKIKTLVLGGNRIRNASQAIFQDLPNLEELNLSANNLTYFQLGANELIRQIDLSNNSFTEMPPIQFSRHLRLEMLSLENNKISYLSIPILYPSNKRIPILNFSNNSIKTVNAEDVFINDSVLKHLPAKDYENYLETRFVLNNNPFLCDCQLYNFYHYVKQSNVMPKRSAQFDAIQNLICHEPRNLAGKPIMSLAANEFTCDLQDQCPYPCHCYVRAQDNASIVNCSYHHMKDLPSKIPHNTNILLFQNNLLSTMDGFKADMWENITELYLDNNRISSLNHWDAPLKLKNISLKGNALRYLPSSFMDFVSNAPYFQITLSDNPWKCNCSTMKFKKWLTEHYQIVRDVKKIICANRLKLNGTMARTPILTTPDEILCPLDDWPYKLHLISVTSICVVLAVLLFVVLALYYRNKQTVIAYVYIHMHQVFMCFFSEEDIDEDKIFDAFISYSSEDRDDAFSIIEELEQKEPKFKLCIHERNWIAGNPISWNIFNSVHNSKRTILIVSKEFLKSMWFHVEFRTAYYQMLEDKIDRLIIIVKGDMPPKESLDKDLQYLLSTKTYLVWEEKWFWEKLRYAMPHRRHPLPNDVLALKDRPASEKIKAVDNQIAILSSAATKKTDKVQEVIQNHANTAITVVNKKQHC